MTSRRAWDLVCVVLVLVAWVLALRAMRDIPQYVDEETHVEQIEKLLRGDLTIASDLAVIPGYHVVVAALARVTGLRGTPGFRSLSAALALLALPGFAAAAARLSPQWWRTATLQCVFLPLLFPYFFLVYTDPLSVALVVLLLYLLLVDRVLLAGMAGLAAVLVRQSNVLWLAFGAAVYVVERWGWRPSLATIRSAARRLWPLLAVGALFAAFVAANGGIAVHDKALHPLSLHTGNLVFSLFALAVVLLPMHVANGARIRALVAARPWVLAVIGLAFGLFLLTFRHDHPCNDPGATLREVVGQANLREIALVYFGSSLLRRAVLCAIAAVTLLSFWATPLVRPSAVLLYPFSALFLSANWLIEQRYAIVPATLFLLLRQRQSERLEGVLSVGLAMGSALMVYGIASGGYGF